MKVIYYVDEKLKDRVGFIYNLTWQFLMSFQDAKNSVGFPLFCSSPWVSFVLKLASSILIKWFTAVREWALVPELLAGVMRFTPVPSCQEDGIHWLAQLRTPSWEQNTSLFSLILKYLFHFLSISSTYPQYSF